MPVVLELRRLGHDVVTVQEDGRRSIPDPDVLARAYALRRAVLTYNPWHFERLHRQEHPHCGILSATRDSDFLTLAARIDTALIGFPAGRWCVRVNRPP